jgi:glutathione synthase/RimK-type ligase-like ATP-grasp enzyme
VKILCVSGDSAGQPSHGFDKSLRGLFADDQHTILGTTFDRLIFDLGNEDISFHDVPNDVASKDIDCVFIRGQNVRANSAVAYYLSRFCRHHNIPCINDYSGYYPATKFAQNIVFAEHEAAILRTLYAVDKASLLLAAEQTFGYPYILKDNTGSQGDYNYLVNSIHQAEEIISKDSDIDFLAQAYCQNDRDYRLLIVGDQELVFERRGGSQSHLNNTSKGGEATLVKNALPEHVIRKSREIAHTLGLTLAGMDIMPDLSSDRLYFLEINIQPQLFSGALLNEKRLVLQRFVESLNQET